MNRDDIIKLGREAGFRIGPSRSGPDDVWGIVATLERFAALVAAAEREACAKEINSEISDELEDEAYCILVALLARIRARGQG